MPSFEVKCSIPNPPLFYLEKKLNKIKTINLFSPDHFNAGIVAPTQNHLYTIFSAFWPHALN